MAKIMSAKEAVKHIKSGSVIHAGGFYAVGTPENIIDEMIAQGIKELTIVSNDGGTPEEGVGKLIYSGSVKKFICSWCGLTPIVPELVERGEMELELNPQGTLVERIRAAGFGLGGVLTPTGLNTAIEENGLGKRVNLDGKDWLYHTPLKADVAIVEAYAADKNGNLIFRRTQRNFNDVMCTAADLVIASIVNPIVEMGELDPDSIMVPGTFVDILVQREG